MTNNKNEIFKQATAAVIKAIGRREELEVAFVPEGPQLAITRVHVPAPTDFNNQEDRTRIRGAADGMAARLRHHDALLHASLRSSKDEMASLCDVLEEARCAALEARTMAGLGHNIDSYLDECARDKPELPDQLHLVAYRKLAGYDVSGQTVLADVDDAAWESLRDVLADQVMFAHASQCFLEDNLFSKEQPKEEAAPPKQSLSEEQPEEPEQSEAKVDQEQCEGGGEDPPEPTSQDMGAGAAQGEYGDSQESAGEVSEQIQKIYDERMGPKTTYRAWSTEHDEVVRAADLCSPRELARLRGMLDKQLQPIQKHILRLANKLQRSLMAQKISRWDFDQEEGLLDGSRLARIVANPMLPLSYKVEKESNFRDTIVTILIDNSGSMRGRPITLAALSADILARTLERCGVKCEVLGFTTRAWKGGGVREAWVDADKPTCPGRLNELRHIIYKEADQPWRRARANLGLMLREGLLKENIDGEALLWAHKRLLMRSEARRILMVISDGEPVDDSTHAVNPENYLEAHLREVISWIERRKNVELCAIGIGHDVTQYYKRAVTITRPDDLGDTMTEQLASLF